MIYEMEGESLDTGKISDGVGGTKIAYCRERKVKRIYEHRLVAEYFNERPLRVGEVVHHIDGDNSNNDPRNLMVFRDNAAHFMFHVNDRAVKACGHLHWRHCTYCKEYGDPKNMVNSGEKFRHRKCANDYYKRRKDGKTKTVGR